MQKQLLNLEHVHCSENKAGNSLLPYRTQKTSPIVLKDFFSSKKDISNDKSKTERPLLIPNFKDVQASSNNSASTTQSSAPQNEVKPLDKVGISKKVNPPTFLNQDFNIGNVHCVACEAKVIKLLTAIPGIEEVKVNVLRKTMRVKYNCDVISIVKISMTMENAGYTAIPSNALSDAEPTELKPLTSLPIYQELIPKNNNIQRQDFSIGNVHCTACEAKVMKLLMPTKGIEKVTINLLRKTMLVTFDNSQISIANIIDIMEKSGYIAQTTQTGQATSNTLHNITDNRPKETPKSLIQKTNTTIKEEINPEPLQNENLVTSTLKEQKESSIQAIKNKYGLNFLDRLPISLISSLFFATLLMYVAMAPMLSLPAPWFLSIKTSPLSFALAQCFLAIPILIINRNIFKSGLRALISYSPNMDTLVGLGSATAAFFGIYALIRMTLAQTDGDIATVMHFANNLYFDSAGMILALIGLGKHFEFKARERTGSAIDALMRLTPNTAICLKNGQEVIIPTSEIKVEDVLVVHAGQSLAADGVIIQGHGYIDTSAITGESLPQEKKEGDAVIGATICQAGYFHMQVTRTGENSTLARIIELVESATASKAPIARLADRISAVFVPFIIAIALISFISWLLLGADVEFALSTAIAVLVISCPCALGLATPTAIMVGMGMGAEHGILFKSAAAIERMQDIDTIVLDKTGTLTHGKPIVTDILPLTDSDGKNQTNTNQNITLTSNEVSNLDQKQIELLSFAASLEKLSEHPLGLSIVQKAQALNLSLNEPQLYTNFLQMPGLGISASYDNGQVLAGNARLLAKENIINPLLEKEKELARQGKTVLYFVKNKKLLGLIAVADSVKENSKQAVRDLKSLGLTVLMLTGDNALTAKAVQEYVDIENILAEVLPHEKEEKVRQLQDAGHRVVMVGDGINDAPALARAHVGVAIGQGTDIAMQSSDVVLMQSDVGHVCQALKLSKAVMLTIKQNLFWAFAYNIVLIPVAAGLFAKSFGLILNPMLAALSMSLSSLTVVGNALRLKSKKKNIF